MHFPLQFIETKSYSMLLFGGVHKHDLEASKNILGKNIYKNTGHELYYIHKITFCVGHNLHPPLFYIPSSIVSHCL